MINQFVLVFTDENGLTNTNLQSNLRTWLLGGWVWTWVKRQRKTLNLKGFFIVFIILFFITPLVEVWDSCPFLAGFWLIGFWTSNFHSCRLFIIIQQHPLKQNLRFWRQLNCLSMAHSVGSCWSHVKIKDDDNERRYVCTAKLGKWCGILEVENFKSIGHLKLRRNGLRDEFYWDRLGIKQIIVSSLGSCLVHSFKFAIFANPIKLH